MADPLNDRKKIIAGCKSNLPFPEACTTNYFRAQIIFFSIREGEHAWMVWRWPWAVRWNRLFTIVR